MVRFQSLFTDLLGVAWCKAKVVLFACSTIKHAHQLPRRQGRGTNHQGIWLKTATKYSFCLYLSLYERGLGYNCMLANFMNAGYRFLIASCCSICCCTLVRTLKQTQDARCAFVNSRTRTRFLLRHTFITTKIRSVLKLFPVSLFFNVNLHLYEQQFVHSLQQALGELSNIHHVHGSTCRVGFRVVIVFRHLQIELSSRFDKEKVSYFHAPAQALSIKPWATVSLSLKTHKAESASEIT